MDLTVIVPTLNEQEHIAAVLTRILEGSGTGGPQVLVVDGGSTDGTRRTARQQATVISSPPGRAQQLNVGLARATGDVVLFCHGDTLLPDGYDAALLRALADRQVVGGAFHPRYHPSHPLLRSAELVLRLPSPYLMYGDQAIFARRSALLAIGGVPRLPLMEDVALVLALRRTGRLVRLRPRVITSARRFFERGVLRQLLLDLRLLADFHLTRTPAARLAARYQVTGRDPCPPSAGTKTLLVFAKAPIPGHAKTRLGRQVDMQRAAAIYRRLLSNQLFELSQLDGGIRRILLAAGQRDADWFADHVPSWELATQVGGGLGERLRRAFRWRFACGDDRVVVVGSDSSRLNVQLVERAFALLDRRSIVLGPAVDSGYGLLGQRAPGFPLFDGIAWGGPHVLAAALRRARRLSLSYELLLPLQDIDSAQDWRAHRRQAWEPSAGEGR